MMTLSEAVVRLSSLGALSHEPQPTTALVETFLAESARASLRASSTVYVAGDAVIPATPSGRVYRCITGGTSASSAPAWPATGYQRLGQSVQDGTVLWQDSGPASREIYDLNATQRMIWLWRAEKLSSKYDIKDANADLKRSQMYDHAIAQARRYGWRGAL